MTDIEKKAQNAFPVKNEFGLIDGYAKVKQDAYIKCAEEYESLPKIHGWVARDEADRLGLYDQKPTRSKDLSRSWVIGDDWIGRFSLDHTSKTLFPEITWESEPVEVELLIRKITK